MKKPLFVITEVLLSTLFVAAAAATAAVAVDIKTDMFHIDKWDPLHLSQVLSTKQENKKDSSQQSKAETSKKEASKTESSRKENAKKESSVAEKTESSQESLSEKSEETQSTAEETVPTEISLQRTAPDNLDGQPLELTELMEAYEYSYEMTFNGVNRLMIVEPDSESPSKAKLYCYSQDEESGRWWNAAGEGLALTDEVYIGENGSGYEITADSKKTPAGLWSAGEGFYISEQPDTTYPLFRITEDTYWVTDEKSKFFNHKVEGIEEKDWQTADHMISSEKSYQYGLVINYNIDHPEAGKGSAVFMHCGNTPTEGCIALPEDTMKMILEWLDENSNTLIWITL